MLSLSFHPHLPAVIFCCLNAAGRIIIVSISSHHTIMKIVFFAPFFVALTSADISISRQHRLRTHQVSSKAEKPSTSPTQTNYPSSLPSTPSPNVSRPLSAKAAKTTVNPPTNSPSSNPTAEPTNPPSTNVPTKAPTAEPTYPPTNVLTKAPYGEV